MYQNLINKLVTIPRTRDKRVVNFREISFLFHEEWLCSLQKEAINFLK